MQNSHLLDWKKGWIGEIKCDCEQAVRVQLKSLIMNLNWKIQQDWFSFSPIQQV